MAPALTTQEQLEETAVDLKLAQLFTTMENMGSDDMGWLSYEQAALFYAACNLVNAIIEVRGKARKGD